MKPELDDWQFRMSKHPSPNATKIGDYFLETGAGINKVSVEDTDGISVGMLVGFPISLSQSRMLHEHYKLPFSLGDNTEDFVEKVFEDLGGKFLWMFFTKTIARIYVDCSAQIPCVYDKDTYFVGSTAYALLNDVEYQKRFDQDLYDFLKVEKDGWFPAGLTAHKNIERILPNHYLDLESFETKRHWPTENFTPAGNPYANIAEIVNIVQRQMKAVSKETKQLGVALTAGSDSRILLACSKSLLESDDLEFVTVVGADSHETDTVISEKIAEDHGLKHVKLSRKEASSQQKSLFIQRNGHCVSDSNSLYHPSVWPIANSHIFFGGIGGEFARAFLWRKHDNQISELDAKTVLRRLGLPDNPLIKVKMENWLQSVNVSRVSDILDLAYIENRTGPWSEAQFYGDPTLLRLSPLITRKTIKLMVQLPSEWKINQRMSKEIVKILWPDLAKYPINSLGRIQDFFIKLIRAYDNPSLITKKLRKLR